MTALGDALRKQLADQSVAIAQTVSADMTNDLRRGSPVQTGDLYSSITTRYTVTTDAVRIDFQAEAPYAQYVIEGTRPHPIRARNARALSFYWPKMSNRVFYKSVNHPGTKPNPFWTRVFAESRRYIESAIRRS